MNRIDPLVQRWAPAAAMLGGLVWIAYTLAALLQPWGSYAAYTDAQGAVAVTNAPVFQLTALMGGAALLLLGVALVGAARRLGLPAHLPGQIGVALGVVGGAVGLLLWLGALLRQPALATAAINAGALMVAVGVLLVAIDGAGRTLAPSLFIIGALGLAAIFAAALVSLVSWMLPVYAALVMAVYGFAWVRFGDLLGKDR
jgi:hypothetical protein